MWLGWVLGLILAVPRKHLPQGQVCLDDDGRVLFSNTAFGMDEIQVGKLFDRFFTVESARDSTGLGLSIAKALVEQMDGRIWAKYKGEQLYIYLEFPDIV